MRGLVISEWIKVRTVRSHVVIVIIAVAFPVVLTALIVALTKEYDIGADLLTGSTTGASVLSALLIGSIGVLAFAQEHTFGTLRVSFAATPVRRRVMVAKTIVLGALGALIAVVIAAVTTGIGLAILGSRDVDVELSMPAYASMVVFMALFALFGLSLGMLVRNAPAAIVILVAWPLIGEGLVGGLLSLVIDNAFNYLPVSGAINALSPNFEGEGFGRAGSLAFFAAIVGALLVFGALINERRDT